MLNRILTSLVIKNRIFFSIFCLVVLSINSYGQIQKPNIPFNNVCAGLTTNYNLIFSFNSTLSNQPSNQFIVELSDENGLFANPTQLTVSNAQVSPVNLLFQFPSNLIAGSNYRIRVRSTSPIYTSPPTDAFSAQFMIYNESFTINNFNHNQSFCQNSGYVLSIDNTANSPLQYPQLKYKWFKNGNPISGQTSSSLNVTSEGNYYVQVDYGTCTNNAYSNAVSMFAIPTPELVIASETGQTEFCEGEWLTLITSDISPTNVYQWYLNNLPIPNATSQSYSATEAGVYYLKIQTTNCALTSNTLVISTIDTSSFNTTPNSDSEIEIPLGESVTIIASEADSYEWFVGNSVVGTTNTYTSDQLGAIQLTATIGNCSVIKNFMVIEKQLPITTIIPNVITPNNDGINDKWDLNGFANNDDAEVVIFTASNEEIYRKKNYSDDWTLEGFVKNNTVYYYKILKNNSIVAKGTLSILTK